MGHFTPKIYSIHQPDKYSLYETELFSPETSANNTDKK